MANDVLNMLARSLLQIGGMTPQQIRQATRAGKPRKPMPKAKASKPAPTPKPATPTKVVGQTNLFNQSGKARDFRNPKVSGNRPPTVTKPQLGPKTPLKPGPVRPAQVAPGQMSVFGTNPGAKPAGNFRAPSVPGKGAATLKGTYGADALKWLKNNSTIKQEPVTNCSCTCQTSEASINRSSRGVDPQAVSGWRSWRCTSGIKRTLIGQSTRHRGTDNAVLVDAEVGADPDAANHRG